MQVAKWPIILLFCFFKQALPQAVAYHGGVPLPQQEHQTRIEAAIFPPSQTWISPNHQLDQLTNLNQSSSNLWVSEIITFYTMLISCVNWCICFHLLGPSFPAQQSLAEKKLAQSKTKSSTEEQATLMYMMYQQQKFLNNQIEESKERVLPECKVKQIL